MDMPCSKCKNYDISISDEPCRECQRAFRRGEGKPNFVTVLTNADRIRSMTDEEIAEWLSRHLSVRQEYENNPKRAAAWLDWLKEEAKDG